MPEISVLEFEPEATVVLGSRVMSRQLGAELVLLELERGLYFGLDEVGTTIWRAFERQLNLGQTLDLLEGRYEAARDRLTVDLMAFVRQALDVDLIQLKT